jgi:hypothetical protein
MHQISPHCLSLSPWSGNEYGCPVATCLSVMSVQGSLACWT